MRAKFIGFLRLLFLLFSNLISRHPRSFFCFFCFGFISFFLAELFILPVSRSLLSRKENYIGIIGNYTITDPPLFLQKKISKGLTEILENGIATPSAAVFWEATDSAKLYTFFLRDDLYWHNGEKFSAKDVNYKLKDVQIRIIDEKTLQFKLNSSFSSLPEIVSQPIFKKNLIGLGDYRVKGLETEGQFLKKLVLSFKNGTKESFSYYFYPSEEAAIIGFKMGEVNEIYGLREKKAWENSKAKITAETDYDQYTGIFFNENDSLLADKSFRQALAYATRNDLADGEPAYGPIAKNSFFYNRNLKAYSYNLETAKKLFEKTQKTASEAAGIKIVISVLSPFEPVAEKIKEDWERLGLRVELKNETILPSRFQILLASQKVPSGPDQYRLWHSTQALNITGYNNPRVDKLLEDARKTTDLEKRKSLYLDFQKSLVEDSPAIFLYYPASYHLKRK
ncbi:MAG: ABC transporter substrate-binding protein [bacterium]|nr:ABC transporter substrate-binding protein [bacterium]